MVTEKFPMTIGDEEVLNEGGLDEEGRPANTLTHAQYRVIRHLLLQLKILFPQAEIVGHRDLPGATPKECPCFNAAELFPF